MLTERQKDAVHARICLLYREHLGRGGKSSSPYEFIRDQLETSRREIMRHGGFKSAPNCIFLIDIDGERVEADLREVAPETFAKVTCFAQ